MAAQERLCRHPSKDFLTMQGDLRQLLMARLAFCDAEANEIDGDASITSTPNRDAPQHACSVMGSDPEETEMWLRWQAWLRAWKRSPEWPAPLYMAWLEETGRRSFASLPSAKADPTSRIQLTKHCKTQCKASVRALTHVGRNPQLRFSGAEKCSISHQAASLRLN